MIQTIEGTVRRIGYNPYPGESFNRNVVFCLEGDATQYFVSDIARACVEAVALTKPGDLILVQLRSASDRTPKNKTVVTWTNKSFEAEQAEIKRGADA